MHGDIISLKDYFPLQILSLNVCANFIAFGFHLYVSGGPSYNYIL